MRHSVSGLACAILGLMACPAPAHPQTVRGMVAEQLSLAPARGATVTLLRVTESDGLEPVRMALTDADGAFVVQAPGPGMYRVQAELHALSTPVSQVMDVTARDSEAETTLLLPSTLLNMALTCRAEAGEATAAVVGHTLDPESGVAIPGLTVMATWVRDSRVNRIEVESDAAGRYRICGIPGDAGRVHFQVLLLGRWSEQGGVDITSPTVVFNDVRPEVPTTPSIPNDVIQEYILLEAAAKGLGDLTGRVIDHRSGAPLPHALVRLEGTAQQAFTDEAGRFSFGDLQPGRYVVEVRNLGYAAASESVDLPAGKNLFVALGVAPEALEIEGLEVTTRSKVEEITRVTPFRRDVAYGEVMAEEERRGARAYEALRRTTPGLRVTEIWRETGPPTVCVQTNRRIQRLTPSDVIDGDRLSLLSEPDSNCDNVQVVVDGIKIPDGPEFLLRTPASEIESMEFITPVQAQIMFGVGGNTSNGVVAIYTRGRGPFASPLRNRDSRRPPSTSPSR